MYVCVVQMLLYICFAYYYENASCKDIFSRDEAQSMEIIKNCKFTVFSSGSFCLFYRVTDEALIAETMVWPNFFLMNVFFALKRS